MKTGGCPKCKSTELFEIEQMTTPNWRYSNSVEVVTVAAGHGPYGKNMKNERIHVKASAYVCAKCSYMEMYASDMDILERLATAGTHHIKKVKR